MQTTTPAGRPSAFPALRPAQPLRPWARLAACAALALCSTASQADAVTMPLDLSAGNASFGRDNAIGSFIDTYTFTLSGSAWMLAASASTATSGLQDLDFTSLVIQDSFNTTLAVFNGNLGDDENEFYTLEAMLFVPGDYRLIVTGVNSPTQASYTGNMTISRVQGVPEPAGIALVLAGLGLLGWQQHTRRRA
jgi:hypothetical protein